MDRPEAGLRQRAFAWALARFNGKYEQFVAHEKEHVFSDVAGTVVEIGPGTGANLRYLRPERVRWIGVDPNPFMEKYLRKEAARFGMPIEFHLATAEHLPLPDASADVAISTLALCSTASQEQVLKEVLRVLKPGGRLLFIEHVAAAPGTRLRTLQDWLTPFWKRLGDGCHPNRETWVAIEHAGFARVNYRRMTAPTFLVSPQIVGEAIKAGAR
jgi:ubiquinone/menaquinone biosynthesis C-methylase UbiE